MRHLSARTAMVALIALSLSTGCTASAPRSQMSSENDPGESLEQQSLDFSQSGFSLTGELPFVVSSVPEEIISAAGAQIAEAGETYQLVGRTTTLVLPSAVLEDGSAFGAKPERASDQSQRSEVVPGVISTTGEFTPLSDLAGPVRELPGSNPEHLDFQTQNSSAFGDWVVWREGSAGGPQSVPTLESDDWRLVAWNRKDSSVQELASAYLLHGDRSAPYATWDVAPSTDGTFVYFEVSVPEGDQWVPSILSVPLDSPGKTDILGPGTNPFADQRDGGVFYVDGNEVLKEGSALFSVDSDEWRIGKLTGSPDLLAATVSNGESAWLLLLDIGAKKMLAAIETGSDWAFASVGARSVVWGNGSGNGNPTMYRWDPEAGLFRFGALEGLSIPITNGTEVVFPIQNGADITWQFTDWD